VDLDSILELVFIWIPLEILKVIGTTFSLEQRHDD
jgi:hypothetical protein